MYWIFNTHEITVFSLIFIVYKAFFSPEKNLLLYKKKKTTGYVSQYFVVVRAIQVLKNVCVVVVPNQAKDD